MDVFAGYFAVAVKEHMEYFTILIKAVDIEAAQRQADDFAELKFGRAATSVRVIPIITEEFGCKIVKGL